MQRSDFIKSVGIGAALTSIGQLGCKPAIDKSTNTKNPAIESYRNKDWPELFPSLITPIVGDSVTILDLDRAEMMGDPPQAWGFRYFSEAHWVDGWTTPDGLAVHWTIDAPNEMDCSFEITYSCAPGSEGSIVEVASLTSGYVGYDYNGRKPLSKINATVEATNGWLDGWRNFEKKKVPGTLRIPKGKSVIALSAVNKPKSAEAVMQLHSIDLTPTDAKQKIEAKSQQAFKEKSSTDWFVASKYGVMFHYSPTVYPRHGNRKPFDEAVRDFDVNRFVEMVKETGAGYVFFFVSHGLYWFPAPIKKVKEILPGRTCERDLIKEIAEALRAHDIKLLLYYNPSYVDDVEWRRAAGWGKYLHIPTTKECGEHVQWNTDPFYENQIKILEEVGERYRDLVWGYWFDNSYPFQLFERQAKACKAGNPGRIIGYNSGIYPRITDFQEFFAAELGASLILPPAHLFEKGKAQYGLQPHGTIFIDGAWHHFRPDTEIGPQRFSTDDLVAYAKKCIENKVVLTINMCIYQDGTVSPVTLEQMHALKKEIRGA